MIDLSCKVGFLTGGGSGIGDVIVRQLIELGAKVGVIGRHTAVLERVADASGGARPSRVKSPAATFVTGAVLVVDRGQSIVDLELPPLDLVAGIH